MMKQSDNKVYKKVLSNGMTILARQTRTVPKVSLQLWYDVGSKDEKTGEKGLAHLIEHMIFKGTETLTESDINLIVQKLSGSCNAFTSYDYTGYLFDLPSHHWQEALPIMADCMQNCTFKEELLASEMKAVIQELKMYRDNYTSSLIEDMVSAIFPEHPYHYPVIGFKQDLWGLKRDALMNFYKKHYLPNNATLVVVGDIEIQDVFDKAQQYFGDIAPDLNYKKEQFHVTNDIIGRDTVIYRDVQQSNVVLAFKTPGAREKNGYVLDVFSWILGQGKGSRLQKKLIDELQLVTELESFDYDLFDQGLFFIYFQPKKIEQIDEIIDLILQEIELLKTEVISEQELLRAINLARSEYLSVLENSQKQAYMIGQSYLATHDENYLFTYLDFSPTQLIEEIQLLLKNYLRPSLMNKGLVLPLNEDDRKYWVSLQEKYDQEDFDILSKVVRQTSVEEGQQVKNIQTSEPELFNFPKPEEFTLENGLKVLYYHNPNIPKIDLLMEFKGKHYYDPQDLQGLHNFMSQMLLEGTQRYSATALAQEVETLGMSIESAPGYIGMNVLSNDLEKGLSILTDIVTESVFEEGSIQKIRDQIFADLQNFWDAPNQIVSQLAKEKIYQGHPYSKNMLGTFENINKISRQNLLDYYHAYITPQETHLAIVGDLKNYDLKSLISKTLGKWKGPKVPNLDFPKLAPAQSEEVTYFINRDQITLAFAGLSVSRFDPNFEPLLLFDQIFTGGTLGTMSSRLFALREQSGLFYTIGGSLLARADEQPGMIFIKTIVSKDRLQEAQEAILETIRTAGEHIDDEEFTSARDALVHSIVDNFESNRQIASAFLFLERYHLPLDYFDHRAQKFMKITIEDVQKSVKNIVKADQLVTIKIGRL